MKQWNDYTESEQFAIVNAMKQYGGGFMQLIAQAWFKADLNNRKKLEEGFSNDYASFYPYVQPLNFPKRHDNS